MKTLLITGASGFIGSALSSVLSGKYRVVGLYNKSKPAPESKIEWARADLLCSDDVNALFQKYSPEIIIHCAAIAHQGFFNADKQSYFDVNSRAAQILATAACESKLPTRFIFLSSISVYGENNLSLPVGESHACRPTSDYGASKLDAEYRLLKLYQEEKKHRLTILRLAPVYDKEWSFNLDRRVFLPFKAVYVKYGSGEQRISALARPNLVDFIRLAISDLNDNDTNLNIFNITDGKPYSFNDVIGTFLLSSSHPTRPVIRIPVPLVKLLTRMAGICLTGKREWIHGCYEKLASSLIFDNRKMLDTGFSPKHNLHTIFL